MYERDDAVAAAMEAAAKPAAHAPAPAAAAANSDAAPAAPPPPATGCGAYKLTRKGVEFSSFLTEEGYSIVPIARADQLKYACNVLNLGDSTILSCHPETARQLVRCPQFHGSVQLLEFSAVTSMYGALHCSSQIVRRAPQEDGER